MKFIGFLLVLVAAVILFFWGSFEIIQHISERKPTDFDNFFGDIFLLILRLILAIIFIIPSALYVAIYKLLFSTQPISGDFNVLYFTLATALPGILMMTFNTDNARKFAHKKIKIRKVPQNNDQNEITTKKSTSKSMNSYLINYSKNNTASRYAYCPKCDRNTQQCEYQYHWDKSNYCIICNGGEGYPRECWNCYHDQN